MHVRFWLDERIVRGKVIGMAGPHLSVTATGQDVTGTGTVFAGLVSRDQALDPEEWADAKRRLEAAALAATAPHHH